MAHPRLFIFISLLALISGQCTIEKAQQFFKRSVYEFSVQLSSRISQETEGHFIASGLSPWLLISTLSLGATQDTLTEIVHVLKMHPHRCFNEKFFEIARQLATSSTSNETILEISKSIYVDLGLEVKGDFVKDVQTSAICEIKELPFDDSASSAAYINEYVIRTTHDAIDDIVTPADLNGAYILLIDALYFKAMWKHQFSYENTETSAFYNDQGYPIGEVYLMHVKGTFNKASVRQVQAQVLELPYGNQNRFSMLIFLPNTGVAINTVMRSLSQITVKTVFALFQQYGEATVDVQIPRFKITSDINNLKELLTDMGLNKMFDAVQAKFERLTDYDVHVSNFIQKADIEVNEDGTVASAATAAVLESRMMGEQFVANKPFIFMVVDKQTEIPLFIGAYSKPILFRDN